MAKQARRSVSIYINGREIANNIKAITDEKRKAMRELNRMVVGSEEYAQKLEEIGELNGIIGKHREALRPIPDTYSKMQAGLARFAGLAAGAFTAEAVITYGKQLFRLGAEMELLTEKAKTVFGQALPLVTAEAERNANAMGLTVSQYTDAAAAIGDLLVPMGFAREEAANISSQLVNLSGALSEWTGGQITAEQASNALSKALLGEREELKSLGIAISEADVQNRLKEKGVSSLTGKLLEQAKATATLELVLEKSTDAQAAFAQNSDTLVRRQAEISAKISEVSEKLATALIPVFERLVDIADMAADGVLKLANVFTGLTDPAAAAVQAFDEQQAKVSELEGELVPLLARYDELIAKTSPTAEEQEELASVIARIGDLTPTAITQIDEYGRALSINAGASREFLQAEKARLEFINQDAIQKLQDQITSLEAQRAVLDRAITTQRGGALNVRYSPELLNQFRSDLAKVTKDIQGANAELARLRGDNLNQPATSPTPATGGGTGGGSGSGSGSTAAQKEAERRRKELEKEEEALQKQLDRLNDIIIQYQEEAIIARLEGKDKEIAQIEQKYDEQIELARKLEERGVQEAAAKRIELERLKAEEIQRIEIEAEQARIDARLEKIEEETEAELQALADREVRKAELEEQIRQLLLSEEENELLRLDTLYQSLAAEAEQFGIESTALVEKWEEEKQRIRDKYADAALRKQQEANQAQLESYATLFSELGNIVANTSRLFATDEQRFLEFQKAAAIAQIAFDTASAISSVIAAASSTSITPIDLAIKIAAGIGTVIGSIAQAKNIIQGAEIPTVPQRYTGGYYSVRGQDDGRTYNARYIGRPRTGLLPDRPVLLASEAGPEYFVANRDLQNPAVLRHVRAIENLTAATRRSTTVRQMQEGGFSDEAAAPAAAGGPTADPRVAQELLALLRELRTILPNIRAVIQDQTIVDLFKRFDKLNNSSGGVL